MIDLVVRSFLSEINERFDHYFKIYGTYLPALGSQPDIFKKEALIGRYIGDFKENMTTNVICGYSRTAIEKNTDYRNMSGAFVWDVSNEDHDNFRMTDIKIVQFETNLTFMSQSAMDMEVIENLIMMYFSKGKTLEMNINLPDFRSPFKLKYVVDISNSMTSPELLNIENFGSLWTVSVSFKFGGPMLSMESFIYPRVLELITRIIAQDNWIDAIVSTTTTLNPDGDVESTNTTIKSPFIEARLA